MHELATSSSPPSAGWLPRAEAWLERVGEWLNPILVKECRQAVKSRQFSLTFAGVLLCCWVWSIWGVASLGPSARFGAGGEGLKMFVGYFVILAFPLLVVVPHGAFRSLSDERDDRTFELLAITTLSPRQIIGGKLGAAMIQMLIYLSAVSPCLTFTYLLRGIDLPTILLGLGYTVLASLGLSLVSILAGSVASERPWQTLWSALLLMGLFGAFFGFNGLLVEGMVRAGFPYDRSEFWFGNGIALLMYGSFLVLIFLAAAARLTFVSENRSTPLRITMFVQQLLWAFCLTWIVAREFSSRSDMARALMFWEVLVPFVVTSAIYWYGMGALMTGELSRLSNRAKRRLPQSLLGRAFLTWFTPGPGTGYVFAVANLLAVLLVAGGLFWYSNVYGASSSGTRIGSIGGMQPEQHLAACVLIFGYVALYLGLGKLLVGLVQRRRPAGMALAVLFQVLLVLVGCSAPRIIEMASGARRFGYYMLYAFDPFATLDAVFRNNAASEINVVEPLVVGLAGVLFLANLPSLVREIRQVREAAPRRVVEDEAVLHPQPVRVEPKNPWDEGAP